MCYHIYVLMHVKDPQLYVIKVEHCVPLAGVPISLYVLNRDVNMVQSFNQKDVTIFQ